MTVSDRTIRALGLAVAPARRARFVEEWRADIDAARSVGLTPKEIVLAAARVALVLVGLQVRAAALRRRGRAETVVIGAFLGLVLVVLDVPMDVLVPVVLPGVAWWGWTAVRAWIDAAP